MRSILVFLMTAFLATPIASAETIHACAHKKNGKLRLVAAAGQCTGKEAVVSWNSAGPSGEKGDKGEPGDSECAAAPAAPTEFALVGITQATFDGFNLKWTFDEGCDAEFPNSRLCGSEEEIRTLAPGTDAAATQAALPSMPFSSGPRWSGGAIWGERNCMNSGDGNLNSNGMLSIAGTVNSFPTIEFLPNQRCDTRLTNPSELRPLLCCAAVR
jgi:hypothetical protein